MNQVWTDFRWILPNVRNSHQFMRSEIWFSVTQNDCLESNMSNDERNAVRESVCVCGCYEDIVFTHLTSKLWKSLKRHWNKHFKKEHNKNKTIN